MSHFASFFEQKRGETRQQRKAIEEAIRQGATTVEHIAEKTKIPKPQVVWNLMGMLRWSVVEISGHSGDELTYRLKEEHA
ncbi:MAG: (2Fe-2S)-binding protein [Candidatus Thorarchaeota archaeon]|nr:(2Fe-2S)-binding protein [Candidatus Thorarchaeota archaeon]